jgi:hypothetical protein
VIVGFRDDIDLSEILPAYREHLGAYGGTVGINFVDGNKPVEPDPFEQEAIPKSLYARERSSAHLREPIRMGTGPATCSTCTDVVSARPTFAWDVNGWYRTIGVPWTYVKATSGTLSRAYIAAGGQKSPRATYYLRRLLNGPVRASYDLTALGEVFLDDQYVQDEIKAKAQAEASRRSAGGTFTDATAVMDEWGYLLKPDSEDALDDQPVPVQDEESPENESFDPTEWAYSYWLWGSYGRYGGDGWETIDRLERWQSLLVSALSARGARVDLAVGMLGNPGGEYPLHYAVRHIDEYWIVFLNENVAPTPELADKAAGLLLNCMTNKSTDLKPI